MILIYSLFLYFCIYFQSSKIFLKCSWMRSSSKIYFSIVFNAYLDCILQLKVTSVRSSCWIVLFELQKIKFLLNKLTYSSCIVATRITAIRELIASYLYGQLIPEWKLSNAIIILARVLKAYNTTEPIRVHNAVCSLLSSVTAYRTRRDAHPPGLYTWPKYHRYHSFVSLNPRPSLAFLHRISVPRRIEATDCPDSSMRIFLTSGKPTTTLDDDDQSNGNALVAL